MKMKKFIAVLATVSMVAAMAAGCGSSSNDTSAEEMQRQQRKAEIPEAGMQQI